MNTELVEAILGREQFRIFGNQRPRSYFEHKKILIAGANGSIGTHLRRVLTEMKVNFLATDIEGNLEYLDVTEFQTCLSTISKYKPDFIVNLAGLKYATKSEHQALRTVQVNIHGVRNLIDASPSETRVVLTSTCKSSNPETVYGATKLIAERMVIDSGGSVARLFNVVQTQGNVFEIWGKMPDHFPIRVAQECNRYFISVDEACDLILYSMINTGRFIVNTRVPRNIRDIADQVFSDRPKISIKRRRGDRKDELFTSTSEREFSEGNGSVVRLIGDHDRKGNFIE